MHRTQFHRVLLATLVLLAATAAASAQIKKEREYDKDDPAATWKEADSVDNRWNETDIGPFIASVLPTPGGTVAKGLSIRIGDKQEGAVCYDLESMTMKAAWAMKAAWTGHFVKFNPRRYGIVNSPAIDGEVQFYNSQPGWSDPGVDYQGLAQHGNHVVLEYDVFSKNVADQVQRTRVLETPWLHSADRLHVFGRTFEIAAHEYPLTATICQYDGDAKFVESAIGNYLRVSDKGRTTIVYPAQTPHSKVSFENGVVRMIAPPTTKSATLAVMVCPLPDNDVGGFVGLLRPGVAVDGRGKYGLQASIVTDVQSIYQPGRKFWPETLITKGTLGESNGPYAIDTITIPFDNPYKALMFISGHDFFSNGDMAACTLHGDVWLIRGVNERLEKITWKRYATGLHQPLGLRIVDDEVYVLGRDQITRLHDRNHDGEADYYENFNNDGATSKGGHDFASCLETDPDGNFYYIRAHEGVCRVSKDGSRHESIATGFRNPIGLGVGPDGTVTAAPQEGNWTPSSLIAEVKEGGYYGFGGPSVTSQRPLGYDPPLCWIPRENDSSSGGQVWVTSDRWGPLGGQLLHLSYGRCQMCLVLREHVNGVAQGGTIKFPLFFESGVMRGRFSPLDGQLYLSGLRGWQCAATKDGCIQRVRYTGKPVDVPVGLHVRPDGLEIKFTRPLDPKAAADPDNYFVEQWNYHYSANYGSKDYKVSDPQRTGRDEVEVFDARLVDDRTVFLEMDDVQPVMQMGISYAIQTADGAEIRQTIYNTINAVPSAE